MCNKIRRQNRGPTAPAVCKSIISLYPSTADGCSIVVGWSAGRWCRSSFRMGSCITCVVVLFYTKQPLYHSVYPLPFAISPPPPNSFHLPRPGLDQYMVEPSSAHHQYPVYRWILRNGSHVRSYQRASKRDRGELSFLPQCGHFSAALRTSSGNSSID